MRNKNSNVIKRDLARLKADLRLTAKDAQGQAKEMFTESLDNVKERSTELRDNVANYVGEKPFKALGIAVLSGFVLAVAMRKKRRFKHRNSHE